MPRVREKSDLAEAQYAALSIEHQAKINSFFGGYIRLLDRIDSEKILLSDSKKSTWAAIQILGFRPLPSLMEAIDDGALVEIYNRDHLQAYRSLSFFSLTSYSVLDVLVFPWDKLYFRDPKISEILHKQVQEIFDGRVGTSPCVCPDHELEELRSEERRRALIRQRIGSPLWLRDDHKSALPSALLTTMTATLANSPAQNAGNSF